MGKICGCLARHPVDIPAFFVAMELAEEKFS
jgi:hypothetical protein